MADHDPMLAIETELQGERASALGEAGRKIERGLAALSESNPDSVDDLAYAVWNYIIIREGVGMYDHDRALAIFGVPRYVMARVGVMKAPAPMR